MTALVPTLDDLVVEVTRLRREVRAVEQEVEYLRARLGHLLPERTYCPHCRALVHKAAKACGACGKSWGKTIDPRKGQPL